MVSCYFDATRDNPNDPRAGGTIKSDVFMYATLGHTGTLPGRMGANDLCKARHSSAYPKLPNKNIYAFISTSGTDEIRKMVDLYDFPTDKLIKGPTGIQIADNWYDLMDGDIDNKLTDAAVTTSPWWSGSMGDGSYAGIAESCNGWTSDSGSGYIGDPSYYETTSWIAHTSSNCSEGRVVLCVCWDY